MNKESQLFINNMLATVDNNHYEFQAANERGKINRVSARELQDKVSVEERYRLC